MLNLHSIHTTVTLSTSHTLHNHEGQCRNLHGHNYKVDIDITTTKLLPNGMVIDFGDIKSILMKYDHAFICNKDNQFDVALAEVCETHGAKVMYVSHNTTAELLAEKFAHVIRLALDPDVFNEYSRVVVTVWETDKHSASFSLIGA
jgi:6-pyruvoyltetrahydropterin/6-carboxytetrahydropterin synthase